VVKRKRGRKQYTHAITPTPERMRHGGRELKDG